MAAVASTRIIALQATSPRIVPPALTIPAGSTIAAGAYIDGTLASTVKSGAAMGAAYPGDFTGTVLANSGTQIQGYANTLFKFTNGIYELGLGAGGLYGKKSGATVLGFDMSTGSLSFSGALDCGNGAVIRTSNPGTAGSFDLVSFKTPAGAQYGAIHKFDDVVGTGTNYQGAGVQFNFSGNCGTMVGVSDTSGNYHSRLVLSANGTLWHGTFLSGTLQSGADLAKCNNTTQGGLDADKLDGYHAGNASGYIPISNGNYTANLYAQWGDLSRYLYAANGSGWGTDYMTLGITPIGAGSATATFTSTNKPGANTSNTWLKLVVNGTTYYIPAWT